jgi:hypothetical protein
MFPEIFGLYLRRMAQQLQYLVSKDFCARHRYEALAPGVLPWQRGSCRCQLCQHHNKQIDVPPVSCNVLYLFPPRSPHPFLFLDGSLLLSTVETCRKLPHTYTDVALSTAAARRRQPRRRLACQAHSEQEAPVHNGRLAPRRFCSAVSSA